MAKLFCLIMWCVSTYVLFQISVGTAALWCVITTVILAAVIAMKDDDHFDDYD